MGVPLRPTLTHRPQPAFSQVPEITLHAGYAEYDLSMSFIFSDMISGLPKDGSGFADSVRNAVFKRIDPALNGGIHTLTLLDAHAITPTEFCSREMNDSFSSITNVLQSLRDQKLTLWNSGSSSQATDGDGPERRLQRLNPCVVFSLLQRLNFCIGRAQQLTVDQMEAELHKLRQEFNFPSDFDARGQLQQLLEEIEDEEDAVRAAFEEAVEKVWLSDHIPVADFTTHLTQEQAKSAECSICCELETPAVSINVCNHSFCQACIRTWAYACQSNSNSCTNCRQQLFLKPTYGPKPTKSSRNYQQMRDDLMHEFWRIVKGAESLHWYDEEMKLQVRFEEAVREKEAPKSRKCKADDADAPEREEATKGAKLEDTEQTS
jgi:hypothetical protein